MITVILNVYKRLNHFDNQLAAIKAQSIKPDEIIVWQNGSSKNEKIQSDREIKHIYSKYNFVNLDLKTFLFDK